MAENGSFPLELQRTKPYGYSLFNLDAMTLLVQVLHNTQCPGLFNYHTEDGKSIRKGMEFMYSYMFDKNTWPYEKDVLYWDQWPVSQASLVLQGLYFDERSYISLWKKLEHDPETFEIQRNLIMRYPLLWIYTIK
jgi:hypothetical protein